MKRKLLLAITALLSASSAMYAYAEAQHVKEINDGEVVACKCDDGAGKSGCKASNDGNMCAQSKPGGNIDCYRQNRNC